MIPSDPQQRRKWMDNWRALLADQFPQAFTPPGQPKAPLSRHISRAMMFSVPVMSEEDVSVFLEWYTSGAQYQKALIHGRVRYSLTGATSEPITVGEKAAAVRELARLDREELLQLKAQRAVKDANSLRLLLRDCQAHLLRNGDIEPIAKQAEATGLVKRLGEVLGSPDSVNKQQRRPR